MIGYKENVDEKEIVLSKVESETEYNYWVADLVKVSGGKTVIIGMGLTVEEASARVAGGGSIMCRNKAAAKHIIYLNGYHNAVGPEIHKNDFPHYHPTRNHTGREESTHIWYLG